MTNFEPYKNHQELDEILSFLKEKHAKYYIIAMFTVNTGAFLVDIVDTVVSDIDGYASYTNPKSGISFSFSPDFSDFLRNYVNTLAPGTTYLFPARGDKHRHATIPTISNQFTFFSSKVGIPVSFLRLQKTFALNYFLQHGTLVGTNLCHPGRGEKAICSYLCLTKEEYHLITNNQMIQSFTNRALGIDYICQVRDSFNHIIDDYLDYLKSDAYDAAYETSMARFLQRHWTIISAYKKRNGEK